MIDTGRRNLLGSVALAALGGCALPPTRIPMDALRPPSLCAGRAAELVVMLPGAYSRPPEFVDEGFLTLLRARGAAVDVVIADAHLGYFYERSVMVRLREDLILPARRQGYARIWLVGISLGGFAALGYGMHHGDEIDGVLALAPFVGSRLLVQEIAAAGGPLRWREAQRNKPRAASDAAAAGTEDIERELWTWLVDRRTDSGAPPIYLGCGRDDRFIEASQLVSTLLPAGHFTMAAGGHDWPAWRDLWAGWLDRGLLPRVSPAACSKPGAA